MCFTRCVQLNSEWVYISNFYIIIIISVVFSASQILIDRWEKLSLTRSWEIITWLWSSSGCRQCLEVHTSRINIRKDPTSQPVKAVCSSSFKAKCPLHLIIPSWSLSPAFFFPLIHHEQFISLPTPPTCLFPSSFFFLFFLSYEHTHSLTAQPPTVCRMCSEATRASGEEASIASLPTISLSADQRAAKQPETTAVAREEHAQQHN